MDSYNELAHKVSWPSRSELTNSAIVVMIASLIIAIFVYLVDLGFREIIDVIYSLILR